MAAPPAGRRCLVARAGRGPPRPRPRPATPPSTPGSSSTAPAPSPRPTPPTPASPPPARTGRPRSPPSTRCAACPSALKDLVTVRGGQCTAGSRILAGYVAPFDAHITERLRDAGAVILGKTNMDEFAMGSSTEHSAYGPTANPWDLGRVPGGSSGGSAAAVAAYHVPLAIGTDTGGSIRQPAALCGIVGLKPTYGRVSRYGIVAFASSLDQVGPFGRDARDAALLLHAVAGPRRARLHLGPASRCRTSCCTSRPRTTRPPRRSGACAWACPASTSWRAWSRAWRPASARPSRPSRPPAPRSWTSACPTPSTASPPTTSSPRPRRRRTSPATTGSATATRSATATSSPTTWRPAARASGPR